MNKPNVLDRSMVGSGGGGGRVAGQAGAGAASAASAAPGPPVDVRKLTVSDFPTNIGIVRGTVSVATIVVVSAGADI